MTFISFLMLDASRCRAGNSEPMTTIMLPAIFWPIGLPLGTIYFIELGISRDQQSWRSGGTILRDYVAIIISGSLQLTVSNI